MPQPAANADLDRIPFPVAYPLYWARDTAATLSPRERLGNAIFASYQAMRLAALLMLADYLESPFQEPALIGRIRGLRAPHWQDWSQLADALARFWSDPGHLPASSFPEIVAGWISVNRVRIARRGAASRLEPIWPALLAGFQGHADGVAARSANEAIWVLRNHRAHREGTSTGEDHAATAQALHRVLPVAEAIAATLFAASRFRLLRAIKSADGPPRVVELIGPHSDRHFQTYLADPEWHEALEPTEIAAQCGGHLLPIYPLLVPIEADDWAGVLPHHVNPTELGGLTEPVAMIDGIANHKLTVLGVRGAVTMRGLHLQAALAALKRKHGDLALDRKDATQAAIAPWARMTTAQTLEDLTGRKYFPDFYVERPGIDEALDRFVAIEGKGLLLLGEAGSGKSSLIARLADGLSGPRLQSIGAAAVADHDVIVAYLSGRADYGGAATLGADALLADAVARKLGLRDGDNRAFASLADLAHHVTNHEATPGRLIWLLLDGLNEADRFLDLVRAVDTFLPWLAQLPQLRLIVSMRSGAFFALAGRDQRLGAHSAEVFTHARCWLEFPNAQEKPQPWLDLRPFRGTEGEEAYLLRQQAPGRASTLPYAQLHPRLRHLLLTPLYLHLFHETWAARSDQPGALGEGALLDAYLEQLCAANAGLRFWLSRLAEIMLTQRRAFLPVAEAERWTEDWRRDNGFAAVALVIKLDPVEELVAATLLLRPAETGTGVDRALLGYQFTQQKLAERILLRHLDQTLPPGHCLPDRATFTHWAAIAGIPPVFPELANALTDWVARLTRADDPGVAETLATVLEVEARDVSAILLQALIAASPAAPPRTANSVFAALVRTASHLPDGRGRFISVGIPAAVMLKERAPLEKAAQVFRAFLHFSELSPDNDFTRADLSATYDQLGELALRANEGQQARQWFEKALAIDTALAAADPGNAQAQRDLSVSYNKLGDLAVAANDGPQARQWFERALEITTALAAADPGNAQAQRDLSVSYNKLGDLAVAANDGPQARQWFERALEITTALAAADPGNAQAQRDLSVSYDKLGDLAVAANDGPQARQWFERALEITTALAAADPGNAQAQRDLSVSYDKLGDLAVAANDGPQARQWFERALEIRTALAAADPGNAQAQRDLSVSYNKLGDLAVAANDGPQARQWFERALETRTALAAADPGNAQAQRDLSVSYNKLGDLAVAANDGPQARQWFERALEIRTALAAADPGNAQAQRDLSVSYDKLGDLAVAANDGPQARQWFERALEITTALAAADPGNAQAQRDLSVSYNKLGDLAVAANDGPQARQWFERALEIRTALAAADPGNAQAQRDLSVSYNKLGDLAVAANDGPQARQWFERALEITTALAAADPGNAQAQRDLSVSYNKLGDLAVAANDGPQARQWFERALEITTALAAADPGNAQAQRDLSVSYDKLGDLAVAANDGPQARQWFERALEIRTALAAADPGNAQAQRDLSVSYNKLGDLAVAANDGPQARQWFERALEIRTALAAADPGNAQAQRDLSVSYERLGSLAGAANDEAQARQWFEQALNIRAALTDANPDSAVLVEELAVCHLLLHSVAAAGFAQTHKQRALALLAGLIASGRTTNRIHSLNDFANRLS